MEQTTFAQFLVAQSEARFEEVQRELWAEADERGGAFDYEEEEHAGRQHDATVEHVNEVWS